jgi:hypothetical protein
VLWTPSPSNDACTSSGAHPELTSDQLQHFQQQLAEITAPVWFLATNQDLRWPRVRLRGARPNHGLRLLHRYLDMVLSNAIVDPKLANAYFNVLILATPPSSLVRPRMVAHVLAVALRTAKRLLGKKEDSGFALFHPKPCPRSVPGLEQATHW